LTLEFIIKTEIIISNYHINDILYHLTFFGLVYSNAAIPRYQRENANRHISIDFLLAVMFLFHKREAFRLREHGYRGSAQIGNLSCAGYGAGINLTQFISLSLSGLLILITTQCDSLFEIPRAASGLLP